MLTFSSGIIIGCLTTIITEAVVIYLFFKNQNDFKYHLDRRIK
jgi:hypothetical protein